MAEFRDGFLYGRSTTSNDVASLLTGTYDVIVLVPSWDKRCVSVIGANQLRADLAIVLLFSTRDKQGLRDAHDPAILHFAEHHAGNVHPIHGDSIDLDAVWRELFGAVLALRDRKRRPLRILLDLSACPRYYALALVASSLKSGVASEVTVFYSEGIYVRNDENHAEAHEIFTAGRWSEVPIPGLIGQWEPGRKRFYLASIGFEGAKTLRAVSRADPDRVAVLFPDPGVHPDYAERTRQANADLFGQFQIGEKRIIRAAAGDAIGAWIALAGMNNDRPERDNVFYTCAGTKAHALALSLRAMALRTPTVLYNLPDAHKVALVEPSGVFWRFDISDTTALPL